MKTTNLKQYIKEKEILLENQLIMYGISQKRKEEILSIHRQTIKEVVEKILESVPTNEKEKPKSGVALFEAILDTHRDGYNEHVQEIKQWKQKILEELE